MVNFPFLIPTHAQPYSNLPGKYPGFHLYNILNTFDAVISYIQG